MLANDQIKDLARRLAQEADERSHVDADEERREIWEAVRHACNMVAAVAELERDTAELDRPERGRRARYAVSELETALESAQRARRYLDWMPGDAIE